MLGTQTSARPFCQLVGYPGRPRGGLTIVPSRHLFQQVPTPSGGLCNPTNTLCLWVIRWRNANYCVLRQECPSSHPSRRAHHSLAPCPLEHIVCCYIGDVSNSSEDAHSLTTNARPSSSAQSLLKTGLVCAPRAPPAGTLLLHTAHTRHAQPPLRANMARPSVENASILCAHSDTIECVAWPFNFFYFAVWYIFQATFKLAWKFLLRVFKAVWANFKLPWKQLDNSY